MVGVRKVAIKFRSNGINVEVVGFNRSSADLIARYALHDKAKCHSQMNCKEFYLGSLRAQKYLKRELFRTTRS